MRVSIVTVCLNQGAFIEAAIRSVLQQDYDDIEYIVIDAGSVDGSRDTIERFRGRISRIIFEQDEGPADGLNKGFRRATGDIYGFLNADDVLEKSAVRTSVEQFRKYPTVDVIYSDGTMVDGDGLRLRKVLSTSWNLVAYAYGACVCFQPGTFYRQARFWQVGAFNVQNRTCWDGEILVDIALSGGQIMHVPGSVAAFRVHSQSISGSGRLRSMYERDVARIREKVFRSLGMRESKIEAAFYMARRYMSRFRTIFERVRATTRSWLTR